MDDSPTDKFPMLPDGKSSYGAGKKAHSVHVADSNNSVAGPENTHVQTVCITSALISYKFTNLFDTSQDS